MGTSEAETLRVEKLKLGECFLAMGEDKKVSFLE